MPNKETISDSHLLTVPKSWREMSLKSEHPNEFGKTAKKEKNTAVIFKEKRRSQILHSKNKNKTNWKQNISGVHLEASFIVILFKRDKKCICDKKARFPSHSNTLTLSGGHTPQWTYCQNVGLTIIGTLKIGQWTGCHPVHSIE